MISVRREFENMSVKEVEEKVVRELEKRNLKVVMDSTPSNIMREKLRWDMPTYRVIYLCNPKDFQSLNEKFYEIGSFAPCPVLIYEKDGKAYISLSVCEEVVDILKEPFEKVREAIMAV